MEEPQQYDDGGEAHECEHKNPCKSNGIMKLWKQYRGKQWLFQQQ